MIIGDSVLTVLSHHPGHDLPPASASPSSYKTGSRFSAVHLKPGHKQGRDTAVRKLLYIRRARKHQAQWWSQEDPLTFIQWFGQLLSHRPIYRAVSLERDGDKQRCVRGFWVAIVRWDISAANHRTSLVLFMQQTRPRRHMAASSGDARTPAVNVALKSAKQTHTSVYWHSYVPAVRTICLLRVKPVLMLLHAVPTNLSMRSTH